MTYEEYTTLAADNQRSRFWHRERGGYLLHKGSPIRLKGNYGKVSFPPPDELGIDVDNIKGMYHIHWKKPGSIFYTDPFGNKLNPKNYVGKNITEAIAARYHGGYDTKMPYNSIVINRYDASINYNHLDANYNYHISDARSEINPFFPRFFLNLWR